MSADDVELRSLDNRLTITLGMKRNGWKIVHEHRSAFNDFETVKVMFKR